MGSVTLRVILWTPSGPCAPWGASGPATTSPGPPSPSSSSSEILQNEEGTLKKARPRFYKDRDSTKNEILQRTRFYKERDSTKNEILQNEEGTLILTITSSTNFNDFIFESSCSPLEDGFVGEQRDQSESVSLDKLTGIRFRDIIMTKIENLLYLDYTIS